MKRTLSFVIICVACVATAFAQKPDRAKTELNNILLINDYRYVYSTAAYKLWLLMDLTLDDIDGKAVTITETDYTQKFGKSVLCDSHQVYDLVRPLEDNKILIDPDFDSLKIPFSLRSDNQYIVKSADFSG